MASMIVAGATGAIGRTVVQQAIRQPSISRVVALTRSADTDASNYKALFGIIIASEAGGTDSGGEGANKRKKGSASPDKDVTVTPEEAAKIKPTTMDWEEFTRLWVARHNGTGAASSDLNNGTADAAGPAAADPMEKYRGIFSGHTYAAMCLGTTRKDAGSAKNFIRCDYDYALAFTEAVLTYSAPAGLSPKAAFIHHIGDEGVSKHTHVEEGMGNELKELVTVSDGVAQSSGTLRVFCQVSSSHANSRSWLLYTKTKGMADEATVERVHHHNTLTTGAAALSPVVLLLIQPGLLERHSKSRLNERLAKLIMSSIPAETCGAAIVAACKHSPAQKSGQLAVVTSATKVVKQDESEDMQAKRADPVAAEPSKASLGKPYVVTKALSTASMPGKRPLSHIYVATNDMIKELASRLTASAAASEGKGEGGKGPSE
ncbi:hypothetical protein LSCM1_07846 [Leishmania martiniquensis]|uniref:NAD(P)-binding domain-containing protein n=1 Tax=Leishmania martiniquensis TaxID=1580590 RepID=A0A836KRR7_9TRYP|nr:hypothetical protein LSCM1_07846 [Leishmania martiniquensis]